MKEKQLYIKGKSFMYRGEEETLTDKPNPNLSKQDQKDLLHCVSSLFNEKKIQFYLGYGTLLGAIRDSDFIKGDNDIDLMITQKYESILYENLPYFQNRGLKLIRFYDHKSYSFRINDKTFVDVYVLSTDSTITTSLFYRCGIPGWLIPRMFFVIPSYVDFIGQRFLIPSFSKYLLRCWYGRDWRIPQSKKGTYDFREIGICKIISKFWTKLFLNGK